MRSVIFWLMLGRALGGDVEHRSWGLDGTEGGMMRREGKGRGMGGGD